MSRDWFEDNRENSGTADVNDGSLDYLPAREHDMEAFGQVVPDESTFPRTPEMVIVQALRESGGNYESTADRIVRELGYAGYQITGTWSDAQPEGGEDKPEKRESYHVEDNVTGARASKDFPTLKIANGTCYSLNLDAGPGGRYGVYNENGERV